MTGGTHRSAPLVIDRPGVRYVATRVAAPRGAEQIELRVVATLDPAAADQQARAFTALVADAVTHALTRPAATRH
jgi:hypothetical protein